MICRCGNEIHISEAHTSYSIDRHGWCGKCGAFFSGGLNKSTRENYGSLDYPENKGINDARKCLKVLGQTYKGDYSKVDGRIMQSQLENIIDVLNGDWTAEIFYKAWKIDPKKFSWLK